MGEEILEELGGDDVGVKGAAVGIEGNPDGVGAAGDSECVGDFRKLIVERSDTVSSWRTFTFSSNFEMPLFLFLLVSRELTLEMWVSFMHFRALACLFFKSSFLNLMEALASLTYSRSFTPLFLKSFHPVSTLFVL